MTDNLLESTKGQSRETDSSLTAIYELFDLLVRHTGSLFPAEVHFLL